MRLGSRRDNCFHAFSSERSVWKPLRSAFPARPLSFEWARLRVGRILKFEEFQIRQHRLSFGELVPCGGNLQKFRPHLGITSRQGTFAHMRRHTQVSPAALLQRFHLSRQHLMGSNPSAGTAVCALARRNPRGRRLYELPRLTLALASKRPSGYLGLQDLRMSIPGQKCVWRLGQKPW
jgi:hypothetical protein